MSDSAAIIIQKFYRNCVKIEERDHDKLPIDPILKCGIPRQNQVRIVHRTNSNEVGLKYKLLAVYDIESLWKFIEIKGKPLNPLTNSLFTPDQFSAISKSAVNLGIADSADIAAMRIRFYKKTTLSSNLFYEVMESNLKLLTISAFLNDMNSVRALILKNKDYIPTDQFAVNKHVPTEILIPGVALPVVIDTVTPLMGAAFNGNVEMFIFMNEFGCDIETGDPETKVNSLHLAAICGHTNILELAENMGADMNVESVYGDIYDLLLGGSGNFNPANSNVPPCGTSGNNA